MNRKGDLFMLGLNVMFLIAIVLIFWQLSNEFRPENLGEELGTRQTALLRAYEVGEGYFLAIDTAATLAVRDAYLPTLARLGGCGSYAGYTSWTTPTQVCFPDTGATRRQFGAQIERAFTRYLSDLPGIRYTFSYAKAGDSLIVSGTTTDRIDIPIATAKGAAQQRLAHVQQPHRTELAFEKDTLLEASVTPSQISRPRAAEATRIVLQATGQGKEDAIVTYTQGTVSTHYLVDTDGSITQLVDEQRMATSLDACTLAGCEVQLEQDSIIVSLVYPGDHALPCIDGETEKGGRCWPAFPDEQRDATQLLLGDILARTAITASSIVHRDDESPGPAFPKDLTGTVRAQSGQAIDPVTGPEILRTDANFLAVWPTESFTVTSCWGARPGIGDGWHDAIDMAGKGNKVFAFADGKVYDICKGSCNGFGNNIIIAHDNGIFSRYNHLNDITSDVRKGERIARSTVIGHIGNTGSVSASGGGDGSHLDFKIYTSPDWQAQYGKARAGSGQEPGVNPLCYMPESVLTQITFTGNWCKYGRGSRDDPLLASECAGIVAPTQDVGCFLGESSGPVGGSEKLTNTLTNLKSFGYYDAVVSGAQAQSIDPRLAIAIIAQETCTTKEKCGTADQISFTGCAGLGQFCGSTARLPAFKEIFGDGVRTWTCPPDPRTGKSRSCVAADAGCRGDPAACDPRFDPFKSAQAISLHLKLDMPAFAGKTDQTRFVIASYNAGASAITAAIKATGKSDPQWEDVSQHLALAPAKINEVRTYVDEVSKAYAANGGSFSTGYGDQYCPDQQLRVKELGTYSITPSFSTSVPDLLSPTERLVAWARQVYTDCTGEGDNRNCIAEHERIKMQGIEFVQCSELEGESAPLRDFSAWQDDCSSSPQWNCTCEYDMAEGIELRLTQGMPELYRQGSIVGDRSTSRAIVRFAQSPTDDAEDRTISLSTQDGKAIIPWTHPEGDEGVDDLFGTPEDPVPVERFLLYKGESGPVWVAEQGEVPMCGMYKTQHRVCARITTSLAGQQPTLSFAMHLQDAHVPKPVSDAVAFAPTGWTDIVGALLGETAETALTSAIEQKVTVSFLPSPSTDVSYYLVSCAIGGSPIAIEGRLRSTRVDGAISERIEQEIVCKGVPSQQVIVTPVDLSGQEGSPLVVPVQEEDDVAMEDLAQYAEQDISTYDVPDPSTFSLYADHIKEDQFRVLRLTEMPAVLVETFMLVNLEQQSFYAKTENARGLARAIGSGVIAYTRPKGITKVIVENGHGTRDPGASDPETKKTEGQFTTVFWTELSAYLRAEGYEVLALNYDPAQHQGIYEQPDTGSSTQRQRIDYYAGAANAFGDPIDSVYVSIHADSLPIANGRPSPRDPEVYIYAPAEDAQPTARYTASRQLAEKIVSSSVAWYESVR